jgi:hypothetical protein
VSLTVTVRRTIGTGRHHQTRMTTLNIGSASFTSVAVGTYSVGIKLNTTGLRRLRKAAGSLIAETTITYKSGEITKRLRAPITLKRLKSAV